MRAALTLLPRPAAQGEPRWWLDDGGEAGEERMRVLFPAWLIERAQHFQPR